LIWEDGEKLKGEISPNISFVISGCDCNWLFCYYWKKYPISLPEQEITWLNLKRIKFTISIKYSYNYLM
jgi:hypothetical protein